MRNLAISAAVVAFLGGTSFASAADLSMKDTPYEAPLAPIWGGLYVGGHVGGLWNDGGDTSKWCRHKQRENLHDLSKVAVSEAAVETEKQVETSCRNSYDWQKVEHVKFSDDGDDVTLIGGVHVGYNWQSNARVFGVEADVDFADGIDYLASLRARLGYAQDNLLLYVTAGVAFVGFDDTKVVMSHGDYFKKTLDFGGDSEVGFVVGAGAEYKLSPNWSVGVEGLYYAFGDSSDSKEWDKWCKQYKIEHNDDNDLFVLRARLSYHFQEEAYAEPLK